MNFVDVFEAAKHQIDSNSAVREPLGDFAGALDDAVTESSEAHQSQMMQYLNSKELQAGFQRVVFDMLLAKRTKVVTSKNTDA